jgi:hypothetical protein
MGLYLDLARRENELSRAALKRGRTAETRALSQSNPVLIKRLRAEAKRQDRDAAMYARAALHYEELAGARGERT